MSMQHQGGGSEADNKTDSPANTYGETEYNLMITFICSHFLKVRAPETKHKKDIERTV